MPRKTFTIPNLGTFKLVAVLMDEPETGQPITSHPCTLCHFNSNKYTSICNNLQIGDLTFSDKSKIPACNMDWPSHIFKLENGN